MLRFPLNVLSRYLVELHGGTIVVESAGLGRGAEFRVELPAGRRGERRSRTGNIYPAVDG